MNARRLSVREMVESGTRYPVQIQASEDETYAMVEAICRMSLHEHRRLERLLEPMLIHLVPLVCDRLTVKAKRRLVEDLGWTQWTPDGKVIA